MSAFERSCPAKRFFSPTLSGRATEEYEKEINKIVEDNKEIHEIQESSFRTTNNTQFLQCNIQDHCANESLSPPPNKMIHFDHSYQNFSIHDQSSEITNTIDYTSKVSNSVQSSSTDINQSNNTISSKKITVLPTTRSSRRTKLTISNKKPSSNLSSTLSSCIVLSPHSSENSSLYPSTSDNPISKIKQVNEYESSTDSYKSTDTDKNTDKIENQNRNEQEEGGCKENYFDKSEEMSQSVSDSEVSFPELEGHDSVDKSIEKTNDVNSRSKLLQTNPLREFDILDELEGSEEEGEIVESNLDESESENGEELPIEDVDAMLEEGLPEEFKNSKRSANVVKLRRKIVLEEIGHDHFDLLPEGWIQITHCSGMPVYLHQESRVCTMARPYYLGPGSSRNHKVPLSAIPCLQYRRASEIEKKNREEREKKLQPENQQTLSEIELMSAKVETFEENKAAQSLESSELYEYCKKVFNFKTSSIIPFKTWADRRKYVRMTRDIQKKQRPTLPGGTKLLKFPIRNPDGSVSRSKGEWIINPNGKSYVCILHEYVQHALKKHPKYQFQELENPATPYSATVFIEDMKYGFGVGSSKKQAKVEAAKSALEVLIPEMRDKIQRDGEFGMRSGFTKTADESDVSIFDLIKIEDPRVAEFCAKSTEPPPYAILLTCLNRNTGIGDVKVHYEMNPKNFKQDKFTMIVGNHEATVSCKNKREGKQRAAQAILKALHPNIIYWGSLLRMYGNRSIKNVKEKKQEEQEITGLQSKASVNQPNYAILNKLKTELLKLKAKREAVKAKGKFVIPEDIVLPSLSSTDLKKVNLSKEFL